MMNDTGFGNGKTRKGEPAGSPFLELHVPPLRSGDDLDLLTAQFINFFSMQMSREVRGITGAALEQLRNYPFPGNVRELRNALERAVAFCGGREIGPEYLPDRIRRHRARRSEQFEVLADLVAADSLPKAAG